MNLKKSSSRLLIAASVILATACGQEPQPAAPPGPSGLSQASRGQDLARLFRQSAPEVLALPQTVFADHDEEGQVLVFGVEHEGVIPGVENALERLGIPASAYRIEVTEPIRFMASLRDDVDPTVGGLQIHFSRFLCTLGFNANDAATDEYSFFTNSHCTDRQGGTEGTVYYQPLDSEDPTPIGVEAEDPEYFKGGPCPRGSKCRYSDAARVRYESGVTGNAEIARTSGANSMSLEIVGGFDVTGQDDSGNFTAGETLNKVGRTTGWTAGRVVASCATVNVLGSNVTLLCQTLVEQTGQVIVGSGDSGSNVFRVTGHNTAQLVGILWGGNASGDRFVFSPLENIQAELGSLDATVGGTGSGSGGGGGGGDDGGDGGGNCPPGNPNHKNCS